ncbi:MAG: hypothetical protein ACUVRD_02745 [Bacteroidia bacterium]
MLNFMLLVWAQNPNAFGLWVSGHSGVGIGFFGNLQKDLQSPTALGKDLSIVPWNASAGASLHVLLLKRLILGGNLQIQNFDASETERGLARPYTSHVGGQIGFAAVNKESWLLAPFAGYHVGKYQLRYQNYFNENIRFGNNEVKPLFKETFQVDLPTAEIGVSMRYFKGAPGLSLILGADIGGNFGLGKPTWKLQDKEVVGVNPAQLSGVYVRFHIGVGLVKPKTESTQLPTLTDTPSPPAPPEKTKPKKEKKTKKADSEGED